ncbi:CheR family methyltransferase [Actinoplanes subtropicus]|uniref:CheR family methyltransferase n=1 Tax=Actinoplanes subtropicus TaxID=543632 RepID=UPI0004C40BDA|nr:CheR family methyltransferase [Actinoplanes subtropicus]
MSGDAEITRFRELLGRRLGWAYTDRDAGQLAPLLDERARHRRLSRDDYLHRLAARPWEEELTALIERLSITETYFFRHGEQFRALREEALPERLAARAGQRVLRMLSVACSSGEEAYSLAIVAREALPGGNWLIDVLGVDANPAVLRQAEANHYSPWSLRETPDDVRERWFRPDGAGYRVAEDAARITQFRRHNVADPDDEVWRPDRYDVIFCRNLLMYLTPAVAAALIARMAAALAPRGYLFLGHTDSLGSSPAGLELRHNHHAFYYQRTVATVAPPAQRPAVARAEPVHPADEVYTKAVVLLGEERFADALALIDEHSPAPQGPGFSAPSEGPGAGSGRAEQARHRLLRGVLLAQSGRIDEAIETARRMIDDDGLDPDAHQLYAVCLEGDGATEAAVGQYRLAAYLDTDFALPRLRLGQLARRHGDERAAAGELEQALALLAAENDRRILLFGGGFGRIALTVLCRSELDACGVRR